MLKTGRNSLRQSTFLIVSGSEQFDLGVKRALSDVRYTVADFRKSAAAARRSILERDYDIVLINAPLPDEFGHEFAMYVSEQSDASVLMVTPAEVTDSVFDHVMDAGILVEGKPIARARLLRVIRFMIATKNRMYRLEKKVQTVKEKMEEIRLVSRAKILLVEEKHMTEDEAHRYIGKQAMDHGLTRRRCAEEIIEELQ